MKAMVYKGPWQMSLEDVPEPSVRPGEAIVAVRAVGVCGSDVHGYTGSTGRRIPPMVMGHEFSGVVTAVGEGVAMHKPGDRVVVQPLITCGECENCRAGRTNICTNRRGLGMGRVDGAYAEAISVPENLLYDLPEGVSWEKGALVEPLSVALHGVNVTPIALMDPVVILGAGTIGLLVLLGCRLKGAGKIIVSDVSPRRLQRALELGADVVVNPARQDLGDVVRQCAGPAGAPVVIEAVGIQATARQSIEIVRPGGHVTWIGNSQPYVEIGMQHVVTREITVRGAYAFNEEFGRSIEVIDSGRIDVMALVERVAPLEEGPQIVDDLAHGKTDLIKAILKPGMDS